MTLFCPVAALAIFFAACQKEKASDQHPDAINDVATGNNFLARTSTATLTAVADAYVRNGTYASNNYGTATDLVVKSDATSYNRKAYVKFDLASLAGDSITDVILKLNVKSVNTSPSRTIRVYTTNTASWSEGTLTWNNAPMDTVYIGQLNVAGLGWYSLNVTSEVKRRRALGNTVSFLLLNNGAFNATGDMAFSAREQGLSYAPTLSVSREQNDSTDVEKLLVNYDLAWNDEFNGTVMDASKWSYRANGTVRNYATVDGARTISLDGNGNMVIKVTKEGGTYYVGQASTDGHYNARYGYYECRARMNKYIGPHIAFWLQSPSVGNTPYNNPAVNGAEIDIFEYHKNAPQTVWQTIHINGYGTAHQSQGAQINYPSIDTGYHTFGLLWTDSSYKFYIDGYKTHETTFGLSKRTEYIILSTELTGFGGNPSLGSYPDSVVYDYVRVYQPK